VQGPESYLPPGIMTTGYTEEPHGGHDGVSCGKLPITEIILAQRPIEQNTGSCVMSVVHSSGSQNKCWSDFAGAAV
jgi:hypothetical protein